MKEVHRDDRSARWIENLIKDARYGLASLRREPVFAVVAIGVLALGIGANTAMFSLVDGVLLQADALSRSRAHRPHLGNADADHQPTPRRRATFSS